METPEILCQTCGLSSRFPGVKIMGKECNFCKERERLTKAALPSKKFCYSPPLKKEIQTKLRNDMEHYFKTIRKTDKYHGIVAYSGGVDSTYVLDLLINTYKLKIIPVTVNMGHLNKQALENIKVTLKKLHITNHIVINNQKIIFSKIYAYFLQRHKRLAVKEGNPLCCMVCHHIIDLLIYNEAYNYNVDFVASGLDRFQTPPELNFLLTGKGFYLNLDSKKHFNALTTSWPKDIFTHLFSKKEMAVFNEYMCRPQKKSPKTIYPTWLVEYDRNAITKDLKKRGLIKNEATGCPFLQFANQYHYAQYGYEINEFYRSNKIWEMKNRIMRDSQNESHREN